MQIYIKYSLLCREFYKKSQNLIVWNIFLPQPGDIEAIDAAARDERNFLHQPAEEASRRDESDEPQRCCPPLFPPVREPACYMRSRCIAEDAERRDDGCGHSADSRAFQHQQQAIGPMHPMYSMMRVHSIPQRASSTGFSLWYRHKICLEKQSSTGS